MSELWHKAPTPYVSLLHAKIGSHDTIYWQFEILQVEREEMTEGQHSKTSRRCTIS